MLSQSQVKPMDHREARGNLRSSILLSGWTCRCVFGPILFSIYSTRLCPENKAASARVSGDINFAFRSDDNRHLIVHESAGLEPGDTRGLRVIQDFISNHTDPSRAARKRSHAIW